MSGSIQLYYGDGRGKTTAALGLGIRVAATGRQVIMIQFLKTNHSDTLDYLKRLEPEIQIFRFEKSACMYSDLTPEEQEEQKTRIKSALSYAKKVLDNEQCDLLIMDEILGLIDYGILQVEELMDLLSMRGDNVDVILTGRTLPKGVAAIADCIYRISTEKEAVKEIL